MGKEKNNTVQERTGTGTPISANFIGAQDICMIKDERAKKWPG
jgi:hypothetical protein